MTTNDENAPRNSLVAKSDLKGALNGIENCLDEWRNVEKQPKNEENPMSDETRSTLHSLLSQAKDSLTNHLERLVEPISDEEYHMYLHRNDVIEEEEEEEEEMDEESEEEPISDDEYDPEELLDKEVLQRARVLRQQVRDASERVSQLRRSVTDRAVSVAQCEAALLVGPPSRENKRYDADAMAEQLQQPFSGKKSEKLIEMEESLTNLTSCLKEMEMKVPDVMEALQETIDTIHLALEQGTSLSQTERAIRCRANEGPTLTRDESLPPATRLGSFLGQH